MIKAILFDFDNTLENWELAYKGLKGKFSEIISKKYNIDKYRFFKELVKTDKMLSGNTSNPKKYGRQYWAKITLARFGKRIDAKEAAEFENLYWRYSLPLLKTFPDTKQTLSYLKKKYKLALVTDSDGAVERKDAKIKKIGIWNYLDAIINSANIGTNKPSKKMWLAAIKKLKVKPKECLMVGDKPEIDLKVPKSMGMKTAWIVFGRWARERKNKNYKYVDYKIKKISELKKVL